MHYYPTIKSDYLIPLRVVLEMLETHGEAYLSSEDCPYDEETKELFRSFLTHEGTLPGEEGAEDISSNLDFIISEVKMLYKELKQYSSKLGNGDTTQLMNSYKTRAQLLERLIKAYNDVFGLKQHNEFIRTVLEVMDEILSKDQRTEVMDRLRAVLQQAAQSVDISTNIEVEE